MENDESREVIKRLGELERCFSIEFLKVDNNVSNLKKDLINGISAISKEIVSLKDGGISAISKDIVSLKEDGIKRTEKIDGLREVLFGNGDEAKTGIIGRIEITEKWIDNQIWLQRLIVGLIVSEGVGLIVAGIIYLSSKP